MAPNSKRKVVAAKIYLSAESYIVINIYNIYMNRERRRRKIFLNSFVDFLVYIVSGKNLKVYWRKCIEKIQTGSEQISSSLPPKKNLYNHKTPKIL